MPLLAKKFGVEIISLYRNLLRTAERIEIPERKALVRFQIREEFRKPTKDINASLKLAKAKLSFLKMITPRSAAEKVSLNSPKNFVLRNGRLEVGEGTKNRKAACSQHRILDSIAA